MEPCFNLWIEHRGVVVLSEWRVNLLEAIEATGSISAAAEKMEVTYHRAWEKVHEMEKGLGAKLIDAQTGGVGGGGATLTAKGTELIKKFRSFDAGLSELIDRRFHAAFD
jgi:molybdate transport system regulatory protein